MAKQIGDLNEMELRVLRRASRQRLPARIGPGNSDLLICAELVESGHLDGWVTVGANGEPQTVVDARITFEGEEYLEQFEEINIPNPPVLHHSVLRPRQLLGGLVSLFVFMVVVFSVNKTKETPAQAEERGIAQQLHEIGAHPQNNASSKTVFGVCGIPPIE